MLCKYYSNNTRLAAGVSKFVNEKGFRFFCLRGSLVRTKDNFRATTPVVSVCVSVIMENTNKTVTFFLTSDPAYKQFDKQRISTVKIEPDNIYYLLCDFLKRKSDENSSTFTVEFKGKEDVVQISVTEDRELSCVIKGTPGNVKVIGESAIELVLSKCTGIKSFSYTSTSDEVDRSLKVTKSYGEIMKEIAGFLKKTVVLVSFLNDGEILEQYITNRFATEVHIKGDGARYYKKIMSSELTRTKVFSLYLTNNISDGKQPVEVCEE